MDEFYKQMAEDILLKLGIDKDLVITKLIDDTLTAFDYIHSIIYTYSAEDAREILGVSEDTIRRFTKKFLREKFPEWSRGKHWHIILMNSIGYRRCNNCEIVYSLDQDMFGSNKTRSYGLSGTCRTCDSIRGKEHRDSNREYYRNHAREYYKNNKEYFIYHNSLRRARELKASPSWVNQEEIKNLYYNRPEGMHIDHIIPLVNRHVCGLHVKENLRYLSAEENRLKSNKFDIESFNKEYYNS